MKLKNLILFFAIILITFSCTSRNPLINPDNDDLTIQAPLEFKVEFLTNKGSFIVESKREYSLLPLIDFFIW